MGVIVFVYGILLGLGKAKPRRWLGLSVVGNLLTAVGCLGLGVAMVAEDVEPSMPFHRYGILVFVAAVLAARFFESRRLGE